jgi:hypothetical protein
LEGKDVFETRCDGEDVDNGVDVIDEEEEGRGKVAEICDAKLRCNGVKKLRQPPAPPG